MPFNNELKSLIDVAYQTKPFSEIARAPLGALGGLSNEQGRLVMAALDVKTIAEFAQCRYVLWSQAITHLAKFEKIDGFNPSLTTLLDEKWQKKSLRDIAKASPAVFAGLSEKEAKVLHDVMKVRSVEELATSRHVMTAQIIAHLGMYEKEAGFRQAA
jgi:hypothetical protein